MTRRPPYGDRFERSDSPAVPIEPDPEEPPTGDFEEAPDPEADGLMKPRKGRGRHPVYDGHKIARLWAEGDWPTKMEMAKAVGLPWNRLNYLLRKHKGDKMREVYRASQSQKTDDAEALLQRIVSGEVDHREFQRTDALRNEIKLVCLRDNKRVSADVQAKITMYLRDEYAQRFRDDEHESDERVCTPDEVREAYSLSARILELDVEDRLLRTVLAAIPEDEGLAVNSSRPEPADAVGSPPPDAAEPALRDPEGAAQDLPAANP